MTTEQKATITKEDASKMGLPTSLEDIFSFGEEGKTIADIINIILGGNEKDDVSIIQRTDLDRHEVYVLSECLRLAKFGLTFDDESNAIRSDWAIPELYYEVKMVLRAKTSLNGKALDKAVESLQSIKIKMETEKQTKLSET